MPQVPVYGEPRVQEAALPNVSVGANAPIEAFGGGKTLDASTDAIQGVEKTTFDIFHEEKQKADQLAHLSQDNQLAAAQTQLQIATSKLRGQDALGAPDFVKKQWDDVVSKAMASTNNDAQRMALAGSASQRFQELNKFTQVHVSQEMEQFDDNQTSSYLTNSRNAAVLNATDDDKVQLELSRQKAVLTDWAARKGIPTDSEIFKAKLNEQLSQTNKEIIAARLDKDTPGNVEQARAYLDTHKAEMNGQDLITAQKAIDNAETTTLGLKAWDQVKGMTLSDGKPDEARMESAIMGRDDLSDERKLQITQFVKARAKEEIVQKSLQDQALDRTFMNNAITLRKQGGALEDALKLADRYSSDPYDQSVKEDAVRKIYAPPTQSDPSTYMGLWERVQSGDAAKSEIDSAFQKNLINSGDWKTLREQFYKGNTESKNAEEKATWDRVKLLAQEQFGSDKKKQDAFLYEMHQAFDGKPPEDIWKSANDKLKTAPGSGIFGTDWFGQSQWRSDFEKRDAQNTAWGKVYQDVGDAETKAIGQGILYSGKKSWGLGDVDSFAAEFGGYDKIKGGTPVNSAIQSLMRRNQLVTPSNVKAVLNKYPDGKY